MGFFFSIFKFFYVSITLAIVVLNISYIYSYFREFTLDDFFSNNHFAHSMGMLLGILFRISGFLSAVKEKVALTTAYALFIVLVLLLHQSFDDLFYIYLVTVIYAFLYIIALKYRKCAARKRQARNVRRSDRRSAAAAAEPQRRTRANERMGTANPSAPPIEFISPALAPQPGNNPSYVINVGDLNIPSDHHTPPPSYASLYDNKR